MEISCMSHDVVDGERCKVALSFWRMLPRMFAVWLPGFVILTIMICTWPDVAPAGLWVFIGVGLLLVDAWAALIFKIGYALQVGPGGLMRDLSHLHFMADTAYQQLDWSDVQRIISVRILPLNWVVRQSSWKPFLLPSVSIMSDRERFVSLVDKWAPADSRLRQFAGLQNPAGSGTVDGH